MRQPKNVLGEPLIPCCIDSSTGFYRDGYCRTGAADAGLHIVCGEVTEDFLFFSKQAGNDLSTPNPMFEFDGLKPGDSWCICVERWKQALDAGHACPILLEATHISALEFVDLSTLEKYAIERTN
ncbi:MAG: DUF2237 domain-containing protein [Pirellulales bacterium]|jgi:uncharacterized protein|nr:DUF2237 domain-containing protein [Pirellulales bacterium]